MTIITLADALEDAQLKVCDLLQHPDDLNSKLVSIKAKFTSEKASIDAILKTNVQSQLDDIQDGINFLQSSQETVNLETIDRVSLDPKAAVNNYQKIKKISRTHQNFIAAKEVVLKFQSLNQEISEISILLDEICSDVLGDASKLLLVHMRLYYLEEFRDQSICKAKQQGAAVLQVVSKYFKKLDSISEKFRQYLWTLAKNMIALIKENQGGVIVRMMKVIEVEEAADEQVLANQAIRSSNSDIKRSNEWKTLEENPRVIRNYRSQLFNAIHEFIESNFQKKIYSTQDASSLDVATTLEATKFVFEDLVIVCDEIVPRFPPKYKIFNFFVLQYHKQVYDLLNTLSKRTLETRDILYMTGWVRDYYRIMNERFEVGEELLEPRLLDDNEEAMILEYVKLIRGKLDEWIGRLLETELQEFVHREKPPETEGESFYCTSAPVILFQMINQQIDIAVEATKGSRLLLDVFKECSQALIRFQEKQLASLDMEESKFLNSTSDSFPGGFPDYVIAWSNNHLKCTEYVEHLQKRLENSLDDKHRAEASKFLSEALDGFMKVAKRGLHCLVVIVFHDIEPSFHQIFTQSWYDSAIMPAVIGTLEDYFQDFKKTLQEYLYAKLTTDCLEKFAISYLEAFKVKSIKLKMPLAVKKAKSDIDMAVRFWSEHKNEKRVRQTFDLLEKIINLLESSSSMIFLSWYAIWKAYNDVPITFIEDILLKRSDLDKATVKEAINNCKTKSKEGNPEAAPSIFSKSSH